MRSALVVLALCLSGLAPAQEPVRLRHATVGAEADEGLMPGFSIVQFHRRPGAAERAWLREAGLDVLGNMDVNGVFVYTEESGGPEAAVGDARVARVVAYRPEWKLHPALRRPSAGRVPVFLGFYRDAATYPGDLAQLSDWADTLGIPQTPVRGYAMVSARVEASRLWEVAALESVLTVEPAFGPRFYGEVGALAVAGQFAPFDHDGKPETPPVSGPPTDPSRTEPDDLQYLDFLRDHLDLVPGQAVYTSPVAYPVVSVLDTGVGDGGPEDRFVYTPDDTVGYPDFHERGDPDAPSRVAYSFRYAIRQSNGSGPDAFLPGNPSTYPQPFQEFSATGDGFDFLRHGHGVASLIVGYNGGTGAANRHLPTGLGYGLSVSPFGRVGSAKWYDEVDDGYYMTHPGDEYEPMDHYWVVDRAMRLLDGIDGETAGTRLFCAAFGNELDTRFPDPGFDRLDPTLNPTGGSYDDFARFFDYMTRTAVFPSYHPDEGARPALFVFGTGRFGYESYGNGWERVFAGETTPTSTLFAPAGEHVYGFLIPRTNTVSTPGLAKNVLGVGASGNADPRGVEFCPDPDPGSGGPTPFDRAFYRDFGRRAGDVASYSPKGLYEPGTEARVSPLVVVPTEGDTFNYPIEGFITEPTCFPNAPNNMVLESGGRRVYFRSGGTSGATGLASGHVQLVAWYLENVYTLSPSPALLRAYVVHGTRALTGEHTGPLAADYPLPPPGYIGPEPPETPRYDTLPLPNPYQGFGQVDGSVALRPLPRAFHDQEIVLREGEVHTITGIIPLADEPLRVVLSWTDPPNFLTPRATYFDLENNLDLRVEVRSETDVYTLLGNRFRADDIDASEEFRSALPAADSVNNTEAVFHAGAPAGARVTVTVRADGLGMDAIDVAAQDVDHPRQDFALVISNFVADYDHPTTATALAIEDGVTIERPLRGHYTMPGRREWLAPTVTEDPGTTVTLRATIADGRIDLLPGLEWNTSSGTALPTGGALAIDGTVVTTTAMDRPAWELAGKSILRADLLGGAAPLSMTVTMLDDAGDSASVVYTPEDWDGAGRLRVDLAGELGAGQRFRRVESIAIASGSGGVTLGRLELAWPAALHLRAGDRTAQVADNRTGGTHEITHVVEQPGTALHAGVESAAPRGVYTLVVGREVPPPPRPEAWLTR